ncbi:DUF89 domain-containing protein [Candidatus Sumerlaeota bacterium]
MKTFLDCVPCFIQQSLNVTRDLSQDEGLAQNVLRRVLAAVARMPMDRPPPYMGLEIHRIIRDEIGCADPYARLKEQSTRTAIELLPEARRLMAGAADSFEAAVRIAIAGNIMDFALMANWDEARIRDSLFSAMDRPLVRNDVPQLKEAASNAASVLFIGDNAGEVVFDKLLLELLPPGRVTFGVKSSPIINDATRADAEAAAIQEVARIMDNGADAPGTILEICSEEFQHCFEQADVVIAKGQGNYETLSGVDKKGLFFLLMAKCPVVARDIGCQVGDFIVMNNVGYGQEPPRP